MERNSIFVNDKHHRTFIWIRLDHTKDFLFSNLGREMHNVQDLCFYSGSKTGDRPGFWGVTSVCGILIRVFMKSGDGLRLDDKY